MMPMTRASKYSKYSKKMFPNQQSLAVNDGASISPIAAAKPATTTLE